MGRKGQRKRVRTSQKKKKYRRKAGRFKSTNGRSRCLIRSANEAALRRDVRDSLAPLRGRASQCFDDCRCAMCVGDLNGIAKFGERKL